MIVQTIYLSFFVAEIPNPNNFWPSLRGSPNVTTYSLISSSKWGALFWCQKGHLRGKKGHRFGNQSFDIQVPCRAIRCRAEHEETCAEKHPGRGSQETATSEGALGSTWSTGRGLALPQHWWWFVGLGLKFQALKIPRLYIPWQGSAKPKAFLLLVWHPQTKRPQRNKGKFLFVYFCFCGNDRPRGNLQTWVWFWDHSDPFWQSTKPIFKPYSTHLMLKHWAFMGNNLCLRPQTVPVRLF